MSSRLAPTHASAPQLRIAIGGAGPMARQHVRALSQAGVAAHVVAVAEPDETLRNAFLAECPGANGFDSLERLLDKENVDVVHVCTPPSTHAALARRALEANAHVYVEKPFAETREEAGEIIDLARERDRVVCAGHQLLFEAPARKLRRLLPALGEIAHAESYFAFRPVRTDARTHKLLRKDLQLLDVLPHPVYSLLWLLETARPACETRLSSCQVGPGGTVHALLRRSDVTAVLVVTLEGRPVESYLRVVGTNGVVHADFVRGTVLQAFGPSASSVEKVLHPYCQALQIVAGTTRSLIRRLSRRETSYPGLREILEAFYSAIVRGGPAPLSTEGILATVSVCEQVQKAIHRPLSVATSGKTAPRVAVAGGTGFLGAVLVRALVERKIAVRVLARREPPPWERCESVEYLQVDLALALPGEALAGIETLVNLAAETAGDFEAHGRNSVDAAELLCRGAAASGVRRLIHVSSLAVYADPANGSAVTEQTPLDPRPTERGPYVWGKVESERLLARLAPELGLDLRIVRPGPIIDRIRLEPPGRLGRRVGKLFLGVGSSSEPFPAVERSFAARVLAWMVERFDEVPPCVNLISPTAATRGELVALLRQANPGLRVVWMPHPLLRALSPAAVVAQKLLRRGCPPVDLYRVFSMQPCDTSTISELAARMDDGSREPVASPLGVGARADRPVS